MPDYTIAVLDKAIRVLQVMSEAQRPATLTEIMRTVGESKNAVFRILKTFESSGFVAQVEGRWTLGMALHKLVKVDIENKLSRWKTAHKREFQRRHDAEHNGADKGGCATGAKAPPVA